MAPKKRPLAVRFWEHVDKTGSCWLWTGSKDKDGYGGFTDENRRNIRAHRASWIIHFGPIPTGMNVCHKCDNPPCVRPDHLFLGTYQDNTIDMVNKGRHGGGGKGVSRGSRNGCAKLNEQQVLKIRDLLDKGEKTDIIAAKFKVYWLTIFNIKHRKTWKHI